jgi:hypothetical protein
MVKQCPTSLLDKNVPSSPHYVACTLMNLNIQYLDEIDGHTPCLFHTVGAILLHVDNVVLLSKSRASLQRLLHTLCGFCTSFSLKIMIFGRNIKEFNQKVVYLDKDQIEINLEYKHLGLISIHMVNLSH